MMKYKIYGALRRLQTDERGETELVLGISPESRYAAKQAAGDIRREGLEKLTISLAEYRPRRSLEQNRMMWALLELMASHQSGGRAGGVTAWDCYLNTLEEYGCQYDYFLCLPEAMDRFKKEFRAVKEVERRLYNGREMVMCKCYQGSSAYDAKEMSQLIEGILDRLEELGVDSREVEFCRG